MKNEDFVSNALQYIGEAWKDEALSLEKVAANAGFSVSYFDRMFARATGKPVMEYVRELKLIRSAITLRNSDKSILDIALEYGYSNPENYTRAFKARYGIPPSEYRAKHKDVSLNPRDASTGTVINRFEAAFPALERIELSDFLDYLYVTDPIKFSSCMYVTGQVDCAVYKLDENEYMLVEEYWAHVVNLSLFCKPENICKYIGMAKAFLSYSICVYCDKDCEVLEDKFGLADAKAYVYYSYAYLQESIEIPTLPGYTVRELNANDRAAAERIQPHVELSVVTFFEQKFAHGNFKDVQMFGMFCNETELVGVAFPSVERSRDMFYADIGEIALIPGHDDMKTLAFLWAYIIDAQLKAGALPTNGEANVYSAPTDIVGTEQMGYTLVGKMYRYANAG